MKDKNSSKGKGELLLKLIKEKNIKKLKEIEPSYIHGSLKTLVESNQELKREIFKHVKNVIDKKSADNFDIFVTSMALCGGIIKDEERIFNLIKTSYGALENREVFLLLLESFPYKMFEIVKEMAREIRKNIYKFATLDIIFEMKDNEKYSELARKLLESDFIREYKKKIIKGVSKKSEDDEEILLDVGEKIFLIIKKVIEKIERDDLTDAFIALDWLLLINFDHKDEIFELIKDNIERAEGEALREALRILEKMVRVSPHHFEEIFKIVKEIMKRTKGETYGKALKPVLTGIMNRREFIDEGFNIIEDGIKKGIESGDIDALEEIFSLFNSALLEYQFSSKSEKEENFYYNFQKKIFDIMEKNIDKLGDKTLERAFNVLEKLTETGEYSEKVFEIVQKHIERAKGDALKAALWAIIASMDKKHLAEKGFEIAEGYVKRAEGESLEAIFCAIEKIIILEPQLAEKAFKIIKENIGRAKEPELHSAFQILEKIFLASPHLAREVLTIIENNIGKVEDEDTFYLIFQILDRIEILHPEFKQKIKELKSIS